MQATLLLDGDPVEVHLEETDDGWVAHVGDETLPVHLDRNGAGTVVRIGDRACTVTLPRDGVAVLDGVEHTYRLERLQGVVGVDAADGNRDGAVRPPMNGRIESLRVQAGDPVSQGDVLFVLEAMKMHNEVRSPLNGIVAAVAAVEGDVVTPEQVVVTIEAA